MRKRSYKYAIAVREYKKARTVAYITAAMVCLWALVSMLSTLLS